jgi:hypothetical protein
MKDAVLQLFLFALYLAAALVIGPLTGLSKRASNKTPPGLTRPKHAPPAPPIPKRLPEVKND